MSEPRRCELQVVDGGLLSTVQDLGRNAVGWMGVSPSGAADWFSARAANRLVGNSDRAALLETTLTGATFSLTCDAHVAVTGANASLTIGGAARELWRRHAAREGDRIAIGPARRGVRNYLALTVGLAVPCVLGSASTDVGAGFGGWLGRRLAAGDILPLGEAVAQPQDHQPVSFVSTEGADCVLSLGCARVRALVGPHAGMLGAAVEELFENSYRVSPRSNRQALRLSGQALRLGRATDIISAGAVAGCVQVTTDGLPVVLLSEHQTTGGYASALCVITADLPKVAQLQMGDELRFVPTNFAEAENALHEMMRRLVPAQELGLAARAIQEQRLFQGFFEGA